MAAEAALAAALAAGCFLNTLPATELVFDDLKAISENPDVTGASASSLLHNDFWGHPLRSAGTHGSYRPLTTLTFRWNFQLHGHEPFGYHLVNLVLHTLASALWAVFLRSIVPNAPRARAAAAALFAVLPVHCDAVASVVGRAELL
ncbi:hypothetical protein AB1Y20_014493, partial [Prymnesium parvum]